MAQVKYPEVALMIQGPTFDENKNTFKDHIDYYKTLFEEIIVSTYKEHLTTEFIEFCFNNSLKLVVRTEYVGQVDNRYNIAFQTVSSLNGLRQITKPYCLKHRTDEKYSNLEILIDLFLQDTEKMVTGGTVFGAKSYYPFHAADHLQIAKTEKFIRLFELTENEIYRDRKSTRLNSSHT